MRHAAVLLLLATVPILGCSKRAGPSFRGVSVKTADGAEDVSLESCPGGKCLTVYVAPWCGYCRAATPFLRKLPALLKGKGVEARIVVGQDEVSRLREYARDFGPEALVDADHAIDPGGVPHFYVSDSHGTILRQIAGLPPDASQLLGWILQ